MLHVEKIAKLSALSIKHPTYIPSNPLTAIDGNNDKNLYIFDETTKKWPQSNAPSIANSYSISRMGKSTDVLLVQEGATRLVIRVFVNGIENPKIVLEGLSLLEQAFVVRDNWLLIYSAGEVSLLDIHQKDATLQPVLPFTIRNSSYMCVFDRYLIIWTKECVYKADLFGETVEHPGIHKKIVQPEKTPISVILDSSYKIITANHVAMVVTHDDHNAHSSNNTSTVTVFNSAGKVIFEKEMDGTPRAISQAFGLGCAFMDNKHVYYLYCNKIRTAELPNEHYNAIVCDGQVYSYSDSDQALIPVQSYDTNNNRKNKSIATSLDIIGTPNKHTMISPSSDNTFITILRVDKGIKTLTCNTIASYPNEIPSSKIIHTLIPFVYTECGRIYCWGALDKADPKLALSVISEVDQNALPLATHSINSIFGMVHPSNYIAVWRKAGNVVVLQWSDWLVLLDPRTGKLLRSPMSTKDWGTLRYAFVANCEGMYTWLIFELTTNTGISRYNVLWTCVNAEIPPLCYPNTANALPITKYVADQYGTLYACSEPMKTVLVIFPNSLNMFSIDSAQAFQTGNNVVLLTNELSLVTVDATITDTVKVSASIFTLSPEDFRDLGNEIYDVGIGKNKIIFVGANCAITFEASNTDRSEYIRSVCYTLPEHVINLSSPSKPRLFWPVGESVDETESTVIIWTPICMWNMEDPANVYEHPTNQADFVTACILSPRRIAIPDIQTEIKHSILGPPTGVVIEYFV